MSSQARARLIGRVAGAADVAAFAERGRTMRARHKEPAMPSHRRIGTPRGESRGILFRVVALTAVLIAAHLVAATGCARRAADDADPPPADLKRLAEVRQTIRASDPAAVVGLVTEVLAHRPFAAVSEMPAGELSAGEPITFIDSNRRVIAHGVVRRVLADSVHVEFERPISAFRSVRAGDIAVRFKP
jgi:hypothetical protein